MLLLTSLNCGHMHSIPHLEIHKDPVGKPITNLGEWTPESEKRQCDKGEKSPCNGGGKPGHEIGHDCIGLQKLDPLPHEQPSCHPETKPTKKRKG